MARFILASRSPRRRELLRLTGLQFDIIATETDEARLDGESPAAYVRRLSRDKAHAASQMVDGHAVILAADTIVVDGDSVLGKPADEEEARNTLQTLRGRSHSVCTAITILDTKTGQIETDIACSPVRMRAYSDNEITTYIATGDPFDKAGAYAIQHREFRPVEEFTDCFANVMGLPLCHVSRLLGKIEIAQLDSIYRACQADIGYECSVYGRILTAGDTA